MLPQKIHAHLGVGGARVDPLGKKSVGVVVAAGDFTFDAQCRKPLRGRSGNAAAEKIGPGGEVAFGADDDGGAFAVVGIGVGAACECGKVAGPVDDVEAVKAGACDEDVDRPLLNGGFQVLHREFGHVNLTVAETIPERFQGRGKNWFVGGRADVLHHRDVENVRGTGRRRTEENRCRSGENTDEPPHVGYFKALSKNALTGATDLGSTSVPTVSPALMKKRVGM